ncbi:MAG TPA: DUF2877 domain-containing protein [Burkholderiales bacterium]|nr:DUF2877 domain-containing protein [Burkholderiales bacterium]
MSYAASVVGRYAQQAAASGEGEVRAAFRRSFYLWFPGNRYACVGDTSLGCGPLNALVPDFRMPSLGERVALDAAGARLWAPAPLSHDAAPNLRALQGAARGRVPREGLGCLVVDAHNSLSGHAQPALDAIERWLEPRLARTSAISGAHLAAAAAGEGHEALHACLQALFSADADWPRVLAELTNVGHTSGWDSLAGLVAVAKLS